MKREVKRATPNPASSCGYCSRPGIVSTDQRHGTGRGKQAPILGIRFWCSCGNVWIVERDQAEQHARWLEQTGLS